MASINPRCPEAWTCPDHGMICDLDDGHDGDHRCWTCPKPYAPGWSNAAKARAGDIGASDAYMSGLVETVPDVD